MIKNRLSILMAENDIKTMLELSKKTGLDKNTVSNWYNQKVSRFPANTIEVLCKFFDCQVGDLLVYIPENE
ncbi:MULTISPECIES: helix-turn-helix transcriptional regulator [unclassified Halanaerobium]|uniref:helix-turn-helix domain-containing protein n=1 Tax=unclassified Halanaerobium TaxID=2641197 RepID=UPI000DF2C3D1|nr:MULTISPECIES: helix-turn-helix transcriptional regulator [unclassified Halanaerobium]RCW40665.1 putative transcriptional regulator [Halanaerobium sp. MA284_MarDTE_T2]RCW78941.1 putative transcriptional regulator [Halanaerobium sp. DL-01]